MNPAPLRYALSFLFILAVAADTNAQTTFRVSALTRTQAPGAPTEAEFQAFYSSPNLTSGGEVAFKASLAPGLGGVDLTNKDGIWQAPRGGLLARQGDIAPFTSGARYGDLAFGWAIATDSLTAIFRGKLNPETEGATATTDEGIWRVSPDGMRLIARDGDPVPDVPGTFFDGISGSPLAEHWVANARGDLAFAHLLTGLPSIVPADANEAIWIADAAATTIVAREGDLAPGSPGESKFLSSRDYGVFGATLLLNDVGDLVFGSELFDPRVNYSGNGLFLRDSATGTTTTISYSGAQAPGTAGDTQFEGSIFPFPVDATFNNNQQIAIAARLEIGTGDATEDTNSGIWIGIPGDLRLLVREGDRAPGTSEGIVFNGFDRVGINDSGMVLFRATLRDPFLMTISESNNTGLWLWSPTSDQIELVFQAGEADPDDPPWFLGKPDHFALNDRGMVSILSTTESPDDPLSRKAGAYAWQPVSGLTEIIEKDDFIELAPDDTRQIQYIETFSTASASTSAGQPRILNNRAELLLRVNLTDTVTFTDFSEALLAVKIDETQLPATDPDWKKPRLTRMNTSEAELEVRVGDIDGLGFGWAPGFDPFSGVSTPTHTWPWDNDPADPPGTDRIMVVSSHTGTGQRDGYSTYADRLSDRLGFMPEPVTLEYNISGISVRSARLQIFVDDLQALIGKAHYEATINRTRAPFLENALNRINQTAPIGKLLDLEIPAEFLPEVATGRLSILIDDPNTGAGEGYAIDFVRLLVNPASNVETGSISGTVTAKDTGTPIANARVVAADQETFTDASGNYLLNNLPAGDVTLQIFATGYQTATGTITVIAEQTTADVNVALPTTSGSTVLFDSAFSTLSDGKLSGQGGWSGGGTGDTIRIALDSNNNLGGRVADGLDDPRSASGPWEFNYATHPVELTGDSMIFTISADAYAVLNSGGLPSHSSGFGIGASTIPASEGFGFNGAFWYFNRTITPSGAWQFDARFGASASQNIDQVSGGADAPVRLAIVLDPTALEVWGTYEFTGGDAGETAHFPLSEDQFEQLNLLQITQDMRFAASRGVEIGNLSVVATARRQTSDAEILSIILGGETGQDLEFTFQGTPGKTYYIEKSEDLKQWRTILEDIPGNLNPIKVSDPTPRQRSPEAFYRVGNQ